MKQKRVNGLVNRVWTFSAAQSLSLHLLVFILVIVFTSSPPPVTRKPQEYLSVQLMQNTKPQTTSVQKKTVNPIPKKIKVTQKVESKAVQKKQASSLKKTPEKIKVDPVVQPDVVEPVEKEAKKMLNKAEIQSQLLTSALSDIEELLIEEAAELEALDVLHAEKMVDDNDQVVQSRVVEEKDMVVRYSLLIREKIKRYWSRPPTARNGMEVILRVSLLPGGQVGSVKVIQSSGDHALDFSAKRAVQRAGTLPVPEDPKLFNQYFKSLQLPFRPEDLRL